MQERWSSAQSSHFPAPGREGSRDAQRQHLLLQRDPRQRMIITVTSFGLKFWPNAMLSAKGPLHLLLADQFVFLVFAVYHSDSFGRPHIADNFSLLLSCFILYNLHFLFKSTLLPFMHKNGIYFQKSLPMSS